MIQTVIHTQNRSFQWIDVSDPSSDDLAQLAGQFQLHKTSVQDCLEPHHLPKFEPLEKHQFLILRCRDDSAADDAFTILELTRKIAIFVGDGFLLTIHRKGIPFLETMKVKWEQRLNHYEGNPKNHLLLDILSEGVDSYDRELSYQEERLDELELELFQLKPKTHELKALYQLKRRASVTRRMLRLSLEVVAKLTSSLPPESQIYGRDLKDDLENTLFYSDELLDGLNQLLTAHHSFETQRASEVMRILAIFSAFFFPLTLIAGIYGMNFKFIPELSWEWGYPFALALMAITSLGIFRWFKNKKWL